MSANISIIFLFCKQMREKRSLSADLSPRKNEGKRSLSPNPSPKREGSKMPGKWSPQNRYLSLIPLKYKAYYSPLSSERGWGRGSTILISPWRTNGRCSLSELNEESKGLGVRLLFCLLSFSFLTLFSTTK